MAPPCYPSLYQINTRVWLTELSLELGRTAALDDIPDAELDRLVEMGFDWVWFLSVWQTGQAGQQISRSNPEWRKEFQETLPDLRDEDIPGSGFAITGYTVHASLGGQALTGELAIGIKPRPVVMVHGFLSNWETWQAYLGPQGYLASLGLKGYAVGDGQAPGVMNTGSPTNPAGRTNSIAQNAEVLKDYIAGVQKQTGAEKVDLLVHSMGGMISRYYIDRVMKDLEAAVEKMPEEKLALKAPLISHISTHNAYHTGQILYVRKLQGSWNPENGVK